jgi:hypothetical protein
MISLTSQDKSVQLFKAFAPMLCKRPTGNIEESVKDMEGHTFILEEKLDGERIQLHRRGNEYFFCSRFVLRIRNFTITCLILNKKRKGLQLSVREPCWDWQPYAIHRCSLRQAS